MKNDHLFFLGQCFADVLQQHTRELSLECFLLARVCDTVRPGVAARPATWWPSAFADGQGINRLTSSRAADMGGGATFYTNLVQVERAPVRAN